VLYFSRVAPVAPDVIVLDVRYVMYLCSWQINDDDDGILIYRQIHRKINNSNKTNFYRIQNNGNSVTSLTLIGNFK